MSTTTAKMLVYKGANEIYKIAIDSYVLAGSENIWWTLKTDPSLPDSQAILQKSLGSGISVLTTNPAALLLTLTTANTDTLQVGQTYYFDVQVELPSGQRGPIVFGNLYVSERVTHAPLTT